jgi:hypothetical protein
MPARSRNSATTNGSGRAPILIRMIAAWENGRRRKADEVIRKHMNMRQTAAAQSVRGRSDIPKFDKCELGQDAFAPHDHKGTIAVASAWLAFYVIGVILHFMASDN